jgi:hypothetical protein
MMRTPGNGVNSGPLRSMAFATPRSTAAIIGGLPTLKPDAARTMRTPADFPLGRGSTCGFAAYLPKPGRAPRHPYSLLFH